MNKTARAFFRGRDSREERLHLVSLSKKNPELLDAGITAWFFFRDKEKHVGKAALVGFFDFFKVREAERNSGFNSCAHHWTVFVSSISTFSTSTRWTWMEPWRRIAFHTWCWVAAWFWSRTRSIMNFSTAILKRALTMFQLRGTSRTFWTKSNGPRKMMPEHKRWLQQDRRWPENSCSPADCTATTTEYCTRTRAARGDGRCGTQTWSWCLTRWTITRPRARVRARFTQKAKRRMNYDKAWL